MSLFRHLRPVYSSSCGTIIDCMCNPTSNIWPATISYFHFHYYTSSSLLIPFCWFLLVSSSHINTSRVTSRKSYTSCIIKYLAVYIIHCRNSGSSFCSDCCLSDKILKHPSTWYMGRIYLYKIFSCQTLFFSI